MAGDQQARPRDIPGGKEAAWGGVKDTESKILNPLSRRDGGKAGQLSRSHQTGAPGGGMLSNWLTPCDAPMYIQRTEYYSAVKEKVLSRHEKPWETLGCILARGRGRSEGAAERGSNCRALWKRPNCGVGKKMSGRQGVGEAGDFRAVEIRCVIRRHCGDVCHHASARAHRTRSSQREP